MDRPGTIITRDESFQHPMPRPRPLLTLLLFLLGAVSVLGVAVFLLEGDSQRSQSEPQVVQESPDSGPSKPALEGLSKPPSPRTRVEKARPIQPAVRRGPLQIIVAVSDRESGEPVPAFQVTILDHSTEDPLERLDQGVPNAFHRRMGIFRVQKDPGLYDVVVRAPGFLPGVLSAVQIPAESGTALPLLLDRGPGIAGTVIDTEGLTRAGIDVYLDTLSLRHEADQPPRLTKVVTGLDGRFSFSPLPPGEYAVTLLWPSNTEDRIAGIRVNDGTIEVPMQLLARHQVSFRVMNNRGQPMREARLEVRGAGRYASAATNSTGIAVVDNLPDGEYQFVVRQAGYHDVTEELELVGYLGQHVRFVHLVSEAEG
ncbi:MAG: hypothetical protein ACI9EF_003328 [Pseudohongiellaceae bacterium]|jgi:hypothetical protein